MLYQKEILELSSQIEQRNVDYKSQLDDFKQQFEQREEHYYTKEQEILDEYEKKIVLMEEKTQKQIESIMSSH